MSLFRADDSFFLRARYIFGLFTVMYVRILGGFSSSSSFPASERAFFGYIYPLGRWSGSVTFVHCTTYSIFS